MKNRKPHIYLRGTLNGMLDARKTTNMSGTINDIAERYHVIVSHNLRSVNKELIKIVTGTMRDYEFSGDIESEIENLHRNLAKLGAGDFITGTVSSLSFNQRMALIDMIEISRGGDV